VTAPGAAAPTFEGLAREHPEWQGWLDVMRSAFERAGSPEWQEIVVTPAPDRPAGAPWLAGAVIDVPEPVARRWTSALLRSAGARADAIDPATFLAVAVALDPEGLAALGRTIGLDADRLRALAHPAALPLLSACPARAGAPPTDWTHGYCPVCGAWAAMSELRGLELSRHLRCGRCGADWPAAWLACIFCGNDDHEALAGLVSESAGPMRRVDTCRRCQAYLKTVTTLVARSHAEVVLEDLATVAYDVSALDTGAIRPPGLGWPPRVDVRLARRRGLLGRWRE